MNELLNDSKLIRLIEGAIMEDVGLGDVTTAAVVPSELLGWGDILLKESGVVAGLEIAGLVFRYIDPKLSVSNCISEGLYTGPAVVAKVNGPVASILKGERTALNFLQRMCGIATLTRKFVEAVGGTRAKITDTRKTVPVLRIIDKLAVRIGGGINHRFGLDDMVLIKDNHIAAAGGIKNALDLCRSYLNTGTYNLKVEVETKNLEEVRIAMDHKCVNRIMLDNFSLEEMEKAVRLIDHRVEVEASGNVSLTNVRSVAETGVDFISVGALTHSVKALDISLEITSLSSTSNIRP